jgi:hypothetical protein
MRALRQVCLLLGAVCVVTLSGDQTRADTVVIESYVGERPTGAEPVIAALRTELERRGLVVDPTVLAMRLDRTVARPGRIDSKVVATDLLKKFADGFNEWIEGKEATTIAKLESAVSLALRNPSLLSRDANLREPLFQGLLTLAIAQQRQNQAAASETTMGELIRSFPDRLIDETRFGPEAKALYQLVRSDLGTLRRGALSIQISEPATVVFINEVFQPGLSAKMEVANLLPGTYRVMVRSLDAAERVRLYSAPVFTGQRTRLIIDWSLDSVLVAESWIGFQFSTTGDQLRERDLATRFGRTTSASTIVTLGASRARRGYRITANRYDVATGRKERACQIDVAARDRKLFALLIDCIVGRSNKALVEERGAVATDSLPVAPLSPPSLLAGPDNASVSAYSRSDSMNGSLSVTPMSSPFLVEAAPPTELHPEPSSGVAKWIFGASSMPLLAAGGVLLLIDGKGLCADPTTSCDVGGYILLGAGALTLGTSVYLFISEVAPSSDIATASPRRRGWLAGVTWQW